MNFKIKSASLIILIVLSLLSFLSVPQKSSAQSQLTLRPNAAGTYQQFAAYKYEDLTTFTESDTNNFWSETATRCSATALPRSDDSYVWKDYGVGHFGNFTHLLDCRFVSYVLGTGGNPLQVIWSVCNTIGSWTDMESTALKVGMVYTSSTQWILYLWQGTVQKDISINLDNGVTYYLTISRSGTTGTVLIYSNSARTTLVDTLTGTVGITTKRYLECGASRDVAGETSTITGYCENLDLGESTHYGDTSDQLDTSGVQIIADVVSKETENLADHTSETGTITSVMAYARCKAVGSGADETIRILWRTYSTDYESSDYTANRLAYTDYSETRTTNPNTNSGWTWVEVDALQVGLRASTLVATETITVTEIYIIVTYTTNNVPSIGEFQAPSIVYANKYFFLNATTKDADGVADFVNATVELSNSVVLKWVSSTNTFSEYSDANGYCTLDAGNSLRTLVNSTAYKLSWKLKLTWTFPEGSVNVVVTNTKVFDSSGASGNNSQTGLFAFEDDLIVTSASANDDRINPSQSVIFTGRLYYQGVTTTPEDKTGITAKVNLGSTNKGSTATINSTGYFTITINGESSAAQHSYTVYAATDQNTVTNQTVNVIVDIINVTSLTASQMTVPIGYEVKVWATALLSYDNHSLGAGDALVINGYDFTWDSEMSRWELAIHKDTPQKVAFDALTNTSLEATYGIGTGATQSSLTLEWYGDDDGTVLPKDPFNIDIPITQISDEDLQKLGVVFVAGLAVFALVYGQYKKPKRTWQRKEAKEVKWKKKGKPLGQ